MAPMVIDQDPVNVQPYEDIQLDATDFAINFDEIASLADMFPDFDNSKIMEENGLSVDLPPAAPQAVVVQSAIPDNSALFDAFSDLQDLQPLSPEMFLLPASDMSVLQPASNTSFVQPAPNASFLQPASAGTLLQPASPGTLLQPASPGTLLQPASPGTLLQPASPGTLLQPASPGTLLQPASPGTLLQPASPGTLLQPASPAGYSFTTEPEYLQPQPAQYVQAVTVEHAVPVLSSSTVKREGTSSEEYAEMPKRRGRKPKYPKGTAPPRRSRPRKQKVYEMEPLLDETQEKKRKNAVNAKLHRDKQKKLRDSLSTQLQEVTAERDNLLKVVEDLRRSEANLRLLLSNAL